MYLEALIKHIIRSGKDETLRTDSGRIPPRRGGRIDERRGRHVPHINGRREDRHVGRGRGPLRKHHLGHLLRGVEDGRGGQGIDGIELHRRPRRRHRLLHVDVEHRPRAVQPLRVGRGRRRRHRAQVLPWRRREDPVGERRGRVAVRIRRRHVQFCKKAAEGDLCARFLG